VAGVPEAFRISCPGVKLDAPGDVVLVLVLVEFFISYAGVCVDAPEFPPALPSPCPVEPACAPMMPRERLTAAAATKVTGFLMLYSSYSSV
jgi:hypothetical protein